MDAESGRAELASTTKQQRAGCVRDALSPRFSWKANAYGRATGIARTAIGLFPSVTAW
jgi:hypothetical protein